MRTHDPRPREDADRVVRQAACVHEAGKLSGCEQEAARASLQRRAHAVYSSEWMGTASWSKQRLCAKRAVEWANRSRRGACAWGGRAREQVAHAMIRERGEAGSCSVRSPSSRLY